MRILPPRGKALTQAEHRVLALLSEGLSPRQIAERLVLSYNTVRGQIQSAYAKLDAHNAVSAVNKWRELYPGS